MQAAPGIRHRLVSLTGIVVAVGTFIVAGVVLAWASYEIQVFVVLLLITVLAAIWFIPRAAQRDPSVTVTLLTIALVAKILGTLARYWGVFLYGGGDTLSFHKAGEANYHLVRSLDFSFIQPPYFGTDFMEDTVPFLYAIIGPSLLGGFLVFSMAALVGAWLFYRAGRIAFPGGNSRTLFYLLFFLPTMIFWPSELGKDALVIFGLGLGTFGLARLVQSISFGALLQLILGAALVFGVRPAVAAIFLVGAAVAFLIHPGNLRSPFSRPISSILLGPLLAAGLVGAVLLAFQVEGIDPSAEAVVGELEATQESLSTGGGTGSTFDAPVPDSPLGVLNTLVTVLFRPFPWEAESPQAAAAGVETFVVMLIVVYLLPRAFRALKSWRNGMIIGSVIIALGLMTPLSALNNFGLLARQRAQPLPFVFLILTAEAKRRAARPATARVRAPRTLVGPRLPQPVRTGP